MDKTYNPHAIEQKWYQFWEENGYFKPSGNGTPYCIMIPPPNVTGSLHMGHGFQYSLMDALIRYHRMCGFDTLWQPGTDHAGISTQMVVERRLLNQGIARRDLSREDFIEKIWQWKAESGSTITQQIRRLGNSVDWSRERFTLDEGLSQAVQEVFIRLHDEGLIYRGKRLVNWDPVLQTAISDLEVLTTEEQGQLWHIKYPLANSNEFLTVATTRPETMLGDTAVAVHPCDERYQHLIGKHIQLPLTNRTIPIIADEYVDREFGSGCVKITPAHDFNDHEMGQRHQLEVINIFTPDAKINENAPAAYQGLDRFAAREKIVADLKQLGLLEKIEPHKLSIPRGEKSNAVVEPYLTDQWFMRMQALAEPALKVVAEGSIKFIPENWHKIYNQWLENIQDWCVSRQLWWGHRIPAWYDEAGNIYVAANEQSARERYLLADDLVLTQDEDVLDTWFSSALWPFSTLGWPNETPELKRYYPTSVLVTGFDIIFFWVARMIMQGLKFTGEIPFKEVYITGLIRDSEGHKMSKSKGNVLDPLDLIDGIGLNDLITKRTANMMQPHLKEKIAKQTEKEFPEGIPIFGTDALRFTFCALATPGREIRFDINRLHGYRNFCNKIWNATRYILMNTIDYDNAFDHDNFELSLPDRWILSRLQQVIQSTHHYFKEYRFDLLTQNLYEFIWNEFCDWYLELSKPILYDENSSEKIKCGTRHTLITVLESMLRLIHPIMPFISEEIWQKIKTLAKVDAATLMLQAYPATNDANIDQSAEHEITWLKQIIVAIRTIRSEMNVSPNKELNVIFYHGDDQDKHLLQQHQVYLQKLAKLATLTWWDKTSEPPPAATALAGRMEILIPLAGLIDVAAESQRLQKEIDKLEKDRLRVQGKLSNDKFVTNAPDDVVIKEKDKLTTLTSSIEKLSSKLQQLEKL